MRSFYGKFSEKEVKRREFFFGKPVVTAYSPNSMKNSRQFNAMTRRQKRSEEKTYNCTKTCEISSHTQCHKVIII